MNRAIIGQIGYTVEHKASYPLLREPRSELQH